ncbi:MAG: hypothetical protein CM1200mP36_07860 [Gammaproteobacteria bacterium]|nr:MAG: hypothetical protein CM1200mP36_07860 [Gammaproteobacteria bacterium]
MVEGVFWIDEEIKAETLAGKDRGDTFEVVNIPIRPGASNDPWPNRS